ncbi:hypothetical protein D3C87_1604370 [compost metagenome]
MYIAIDRKADLKHGNRQRFGHVGQQGFGYQSSFFRTADIRDVDQNGNAAARPPVNAEEGF